MSLLLRLNSDVCRNLSLPSSKTFGVGLFRFLYLQLSFRHIYMNRNKRLSDRSTLTPPYLLLVCYIILSGLKYVPPKTEFESFVFEFELLNLLNGLFHNLTLSFKFIGLHFRTSKWNFQLYYSNSGFVMLWFSLNSTNSNYVIQIQVLVGCISAIYPFAALSDLCIFMCYKIFTEHLFSVFLFQPAVLYMKPRMFHLFFRTIKISFASCTFLIPCSH